MYRVSVMIFLVALFLTAPAQAQDVPAPGSSPKPAVAAEVPAATVSSQRAEVAPIEVPPAVAQDDDDDDDYDDEYEDEYEDEAQNQIQAEKKKKKKFTLNGFLQNQTGFFVSSEKTCNRMIPFGIPGHSNKDLAAEYFDYPTDHGGLLGELSMMRNTLQLEGDWEPSDDVTVHFLFRGVRSLQLGADDRAQPPDPGKVDDVRSWVHENYYTENDLREFYVDINATKKLNFRLGRQQVTWGELGQYRLLDVINPVNSTWHFGSLESFEDIRIPLWIGKSLLDIPALDGALEFVWVPMLDDPDKLVTTPLTFAGAWGLPPQPQPSYGNAGVGVPEGIYAKPSALEILRKEFKYPENDIENSRLGARWKGTLGDATYTLVYYWTHQLTPPVPTGYRLQWQNPAGFEMKAGKISEVGALEQGATVELEYPRQHITGFSLDYTFNHPIGSVVRLEAAFEPDRTYPTASWPKLDKYHVPQFDVLGWNDLNPEDRIDQTFALPTHQKKVLSYGVQIMRPTFIRWLNPKNSIMLIAQFMHTWIVDFDKNQRILDVPGYDTTLSKEHSMTIVGSFFTYYLNGLIMPRFVGVYIPGEFQGGFIHGQLNFNVGTHWRITAGTAWFFGEHPYKHVGLFRDRDEVYLRVRYQF